MVGIHLVPVMQRSLVIDRSQLPWSRKYRPAHLDQVILPEQMRLLLEMFLDETKTCHLILTGTPGVGKSAIAECLIKQLMPPQYRDAGCLDLNTPELRGTEGAEEALIPFCRRQLTGPAHKIVLVDEADSMSQEHQASVVEAIKTYGKHVKFLFTCSATCDISENLQSLCHIVLIPKLTEPQIIQFLQHIADQEHLLCEPSGLEIIASAVGGDLRKAINELQKVASGLQDERGIEITRKRALQMCNLPDPIVITVILRACLNLQLATAIEKMGKLLSQGYYHSDILESFRHVIVKYEMPEQTRIGLLTVVSYSKLDTAQGKGARTHLQFEGMIARMYLYLVENPVNHD